MDFIFLLFFACIFGVSSRLLSMSSWDSD